MSDINTISWSEQTNLSWSDFKAESNPAVFEDAHSSIKYRPTWTVNSEKMGSDILFFIENIDISTEFHPLLSWVRESYATDNLLKHEQGHFDLAELIKREKLPELQDMFYGKKFPTRGKNEEQRKQYAKEDSGKMIAQEVSKLEEILAKRRQDYDVETNFGNSVEKQSDYDSIFKKLRP